MKILVFSDSHGKTGRMLDVINKAQDIEMVIHLGDLVKDAEEIICGFDRLKVEYVAGNNDYYSSAPNEKMIEIEGKKFFITHGNAYAVKNGYMRLENRGKELGVDVVLFGHTHRPYENYHGGILLINPGSITIPVARTGPSYCVLEVSEEKITVKICSY